jgi:TolA-binding protein
MYIKLFSLIVYIFSLTLLADEVSVFGAGDLESNSPYGLTDSEKVILKNKKQLTKFDRRVDGVKSNIELLSERIDGLESIFDGDGRKLNKTAHKLSKLSSQYETDRLLLNKLSKTQKQNTKDINQLKKTLNSLIKQIDKEYVTKKQFDELVAFINKKFSQKTNVKKKTKKSNKTLLEEAKVLFSKDYFTKAIPIFEQLIKEKYRPAECNFYLGEIWFYRKKYKDAIHYFKTSMMLYDKAKYIPKLLLHSAISFEKTNDLENASNFYGTLIDVYPDTQEAKKAQANLMNIN